MEQFDDKTEMPLDDALEEIIQGIITSEVHTITVGEIQSFNAGEQTANIQPVLKRRFVDEDDARQLPLLESVPVHFFGSGDYVETVELKKGSYVILLICERAIDNWFNQGGIVDPDRTRKFDFSDSIALAGLNPKPNSLSPGVQPGIGFRKVDGSEYIQLNDNGVQVVASLVKLGAELGTQPLLKVDPLLDTIWQTYFTAAAAAWNAISIIPPIGTPGTPNPACVTAATAATAMKPALNAYKTTKVEGV